MENLNILPCELLVEIAKRLKKLEDFTCFRSVSRSLHLYVEEEDFEGLRFRKSLPYLMIPPVSSNIDDNNVDIRRQFYSLIEGESIVASLEVPMFKTSTKRILINKMVLSSRPNETTDFILMVIIGEYKQLAFWRLGDTAWNQFDGRGFSDVVYIGGEQFYAIASVGEISVINLAVAGHVECRIIIKYIPVLCIIYSLQRLYILKTINGSLLGITRTKSTKFFLTDEFRAYDIDIETGKCKEIYSLGRMAIFLGRNSSFAVDATASNGVGVIKANHIYFTDDFKEFQHAYFAGGDSRYYAGGPRNAECVKGCMLDSGVYNFETKSIEAIYPVEPLLRNVCPAMWITPH